VKVFADAAFVALGLTIFLVQSLSASDDFDLHFEQGTLLLTQGRTAEAKLEFARCLELRPKHAGLHYQLARLHFLDFNQTPDLRVAFQALPVALAEVGKTLKENPTHLDALRLKFDLLRFPKLLHYDPNAAFETALEMISLNPSCYDFRLEAAQWMSGEVRFVTNRKKQVPQDSIVGLERALTQFDSALKAVPPYSSQEQRGLFLMARTLAKAGRFSESLAYFQSRLQRPLSDEERMESFRGLATSYFRLGRFREAAEACLNALRSKLNAIDLWLLRISAERVKGGVSIVPQQYVFPLREEPQASLKNGLLEFTDIAPALKINRLDGNGPCAWGDYDHDGDLDLLVGGSDRFIALYKNNAGSFSEATVQAKLSGMPSGYSLNFVDYDNDGWLDIYVCLNGWSGPLPNRLLRNLGNGTFQDVSKPAGVDDAGSGFVSLWGDLDRDGDLDLVVANGVLKDGSTPQIYRNQGDGTFENVTRKAGMVEPPEYGTIGIALGDYDRDGDLDLFINGWDPAPNRLYRNNGDFTFTEVAQQAGVTQPSHGGFVCFFFDYNNDAYPDILATSLAPWPAVVESLKRGFSVRSPSELHPDAPRLFRNEKNGTFSDVTVESGLYFPMGIMAGGVADLDNDGFLDLYFGTGDPELSRLEPNRFFHNNGDGTFSDLTMTTGLGNLGKGHGITFVDFDNDGDLDLYAQLGGFFRGDWWENAFYRNEKGNQNHWLQIELAGSKTNRFAVGTVVIARAGDLTFYREVKGSEGFGSTDPYRVSLGLGRRSQVDELQVLWPSGKKQEFHSIGADRLIEIRETDSQFRTVR